MKNYNLELSLYECADLVLLLVNKIDELNERMEKNEKLGYKTDYLKYRLEEFQTLKDKIIDQSKQQDK